MRGRCYDGKSELAMLYFPHVKTTKGAMNKFIAYSDQTDGPKKG